MTTETATINGCGDCRHWLQHAQGGICRARPPVPILIGMRQAISGHQPAVATFFPETAADMGCGEWAARPADLRQIDFSRLETVQGEA